MHPVHVRYAESLLDPEWVPAFDEAAAVTDTGSLLKQLFRMGGMAEAMNAVTPATMQVTVFVYNVCRTTKPYGSAKKVAPAKPCMLADVHSRRAVVRR